MDSLFAHIADIAQKSGDLPALRDSKRSVSYEALVEEVMSCGKVLSKYRVQTGSRVFLSGENSMKLVAWILALQQAGAEVFLVDPRIGAVEWKTIRDDIPVNFILAGPNTFLHQEASKGDDLLEEGYCLLSAGSENTGTQTGDLYFFSSGTTGIPKAFGFSARHLYEKIRLLSAHLQHRSSDKTLCPLTITHSHGFVVSFATLLAGGEVHYLPPDKSKAEDILSHVHRHRITIMTGVPYQYNQLLAMGGEMDGHLQTLRYAYCGSAPLSEFLAMGMQEKYGVRLNQAYGVSEIGPVCVNLFEDGEDNFGSTGKVMPHIDYKILNEEGQAVEPGQEGELVVRSSYMSRGYLNAPEETALTFREGWIYTQDIVREDSRKNIYILGRKNNFINVSGYKVYPVEVEKVLLSMKGIKDAIVVAAEDEARGQAVRAVVSTFFPMEKKEILAWCAEHLASYKVPAQLQIEDELPHNSLHKVSYTLYSNKHKDTT